MPPLAEEEPNGPVMPSPREPSSSTIFDPPKIGTASREHADRVRYPEGSRHTDIGHFHTNVTWNDPLAPQFGTEYAPRTARADRNGYAPRSHCTSPAQPRTGRNNRNGHVPPGSPHSWHTSQEAQIELATRREDHVTRIMDRSTRSRRGTIPRRGPRHANHGQIHALTTRNDTSGEQL